MENAQRAFQYFTSIGYSPVQAAAIVGNLMQESGPNLDVNATGDAGTAFGIAQWRHDRVAGLQQFAAQRGTDWRDFDTQLAYVDHELRTTENRAGNALRGSQNLDQAVAAMIGYERPQGWTLANPQAGHGWDNRMAYATQLAGGVPGAATGAPMDLAQMAQGGARPTGAAPATPAAEPRPTPIADAIQSVGNALTAPKEAAPEPQQAKQPQMAAQMLGQMPEFVAPTAEELSTAPAPLENGLIRGFGAPPAGAMAPVDPLRPMFGAARNAPLRGGTKIRA